MTPRETVFPGTIRYQRCSRCGSELGEVHSLSDYDPDALCPACEGDKAQEDALAEARLEVLDFVDRELRKYLSDDLRTAVWNEACKKFRLPPEEE